MSTGSKGTPAATRAAGTAASAQAGRPTPFRLEPDSFLGQLGRGLAAVLRQKGGSITLRLNPESLGQLKINLNMEDSRITARFEATNPQTRELLTQHSDSLRQALEGRGLNVDHIAIASETETARQNHSEPGRSHDGAGSPNNQQSTGSHSNGQRPTSDNSANQEPWKSATTLHAPATDQVIETMRIGYTAADAGPDAGTPRVLLDAIA